MQNFRKIVSEASVVYPKVRTWTSKTLFEREAHHGYSHAQDVRALSQTIATSEGVLSRNAYPLMYTIAIMHDVDDKKVDPMGVYKQQMHRFLLRNVSPQLFDFIISAVARISMSYEITHGSADWVRVLGPSGLLIRNYVSDADKLLSLGAAGHKRIVDFNMCEILLAEHVNGNISEAQVYNDFADRLVSCVSQVMRVRMRFVPNYLRTPYAKSHAVKLMQELELTHDVWKHSLYRR